MAFIVLLVISLSTLLQVETSSAKGQLAILEARQNALLGMQVALGELQATAGADQRSVARADVMFKHQSVAGASSVFPASLETVDDTRSFWVGVSHSNMDANGDLALNDPERFGPSNQSVYWLVSGLNAEQAPVTQLSTAFAPDDEVEMITVRQNAAPATSAVEITLKAGKVPVTDSDGSDTAAFAWIIDDETQKAKLIPADPAVDNDTPSAKMVPGTRRSLLPGFFNLSQVVRSNENVPLDLGPVGADTIFLADRFEELDVIGASNAEVVNDRIFDYTLTGFGVLADTRNGGLKRDLTAAYEDPSVFNDLFPSRTAPYTSDINPDDGNNNAYIAMEPLKFSSPDASDLRENGYIHHGIFRDYYNLPDRIIGDDRIRISVIDNELFNNESFQSTDGRKTGYGNVGPHEFTNRNHPYGEFLVWSGFGSPTSDGAHNPITPVLAHMQQNAWMEQATGLRANEGLGSNPQYANYVGNAQLWKAIYNPYNISIELGAERNRGPVIQGFPQTYVHIYRNNDKNYLSIDTDGSDTRGFLYRNQLWMYGADPVILAPGRTQMYGFSDDVDVGDTEGGDSNNTFSSDIASATSFSSNRVYTIELSENVDTDGNVTYEVPEIDLLAEFSFTGTNWTSPPPSWHGPNMGWGLPFEGYNDGDDAKEDPGYEMAQIFYAPFSRQILTDGVDEGINKNALDRRFSNLLDGSPGLQIYRERVDFGTEREMADEAFYRFRLRTTTESGSSLRPLIDGNIRAIWNNPKWDDIPGLSLDTLASYTFSSNKNSPGEPYDNVSQPEGDEGFLSYGNSVTVTGASRVILFDIPREPLVSIGQLQHAAAGRFSYEPSYVVGNSYANPRIPLSEWVETEAEDTFSPGRLPSPFGITNNFSLFDASFIVNEALFDGFTFSTIPQSSSAGELDDYLVRNRLLANPRYVPYEPAGLTFDEENLILAEESGRTNAGFLLVDGAFNVNSTSVDAWEVFLSGTKGLAFGRINQFGGVTGFDPVDEIRFPRVQSSFGDAWNGSNDNDDAWTGFRELTQNEVRDLANRIVELIRERGPFHNLSDFINRSPGSANPEAQKSGVLQAALDDTLNSSVPSSLQLDAASLAQIPTGSSQGAAFPTNILQGDILQALAPYMQTRSDTFKIRSYGEVVDPLTGDQRRVWCEAVVQRLPDPVRVSGGSSALDELARPSSEFGRQFKIVSFRWLSEDEV
jgi:hypothetical protein